MFFPKITNMGKIIVNNLNKKTSKSSLGEDFAVKYISHPPPRLTLDNIVKNSLAIIVQWEG